MKELDFDELDRAVNSLMTNTSKTPPPPKKETEQTLTITPTIKSDAMPSLDTLDKTVSQINGQPRPQKSVAAPTPPPAPPVAEAASVSAVAAPSSTASPSVAARRGRFMDMVRPGASSPAAEPVRTVSRQGVTVEPAGPLVTDIIPPSNSVDKKADTVQKQPEVAAPHFDREPDTSSKKNTDSEWPDPLDMMIDTTEKKDSSSPVPASSPVKSSGFGDDYPLSSPFLADTRVEKRPLGGVQLLNEGDEEKLLPSGDEANGDTQVNKESADVDSEKQLPADPSDALAAATLPEELSGDVMALESDANTMAVSAASEKAAVIADQESALQPDKKAEAPEAIKETVLIEPQEKEAEPVVRENRHTEPAAQSSIPAGPISIPQQYREEPSTGDAGNGAIYDTDTYHQPLAHPKKKKSGWMWVIWILLFLVVGAAGGAALYFLGVF